MYRWCGSHFYSVGDFDTTVCFGFLEIDDGLQFEKYLFGHKLTDIAHFFCLVLICIFNIFLLSINFTQNWSNLFLHIYCYKIVQNGRYMYRHPCAQFQQGFHWTTSLDTSLTFAETLRISLLITTCLENIKNSTWMSSIIPHTFTHKLTLCFSHAYQAKNHYRVECRWSLKIISYSMVAQSFTIDSHNNFPLFTCISGVHAKILCFLFSHNCTIQKIWYPYKNTIQSAASNTCIWKEDVMPLFIIFELFNNTKRLNQNWPSP